MKAGASRRSPDRRHHSGVIPGRVENAIPESETARTGLASPARFIPRSANILRAPRRMSGTWVLPIRFPNSAHANASLQVEGAERREAPGTFRSHPFRLRDDASIRRRRKDARRFAALRFGDFRTRAALFVNALARKALLRQPCSRQASLVSPGGGPAPSRSAAANRARRRRPLPAIKTPHERALDGNGMRNVSA